MRVAEASNTLGFFESTTVLDTLANKEQLDHWASVNQYVQIDTPQGYPIGKSSNMGDLRLGALPAGTSQRFTFASDTDGVSLLVLDRTLTRSGKIIAIRARRAAARHHRSRNEPRANHPAVGGGGGMPRRHHRLALHRAQPGRPPSCA